MLWLTLAACGTETLVDPAPGEAAVEAAPEVVPSEAPTENPASQPLAIPVDAPIEPIVSTTGVGFIGHDTTRAMLVEKLGEAAITETKFDLGEGMFAPGLEVLGGTPYALRLKTDGTTVDRIQVLGEAYRTDNGLQLGASLGDLRAALGDFKLYGYGWDWGGTVVATPVRESSFRLAVGTQPRHQPKRGDTHWSKAAQAILSGGDRQFSSDTEGLEEIDPYVATITLVWREVTPDEEAASP
ncbi:MAG: hypothetical protein AAGA48_05900 [Myxococcota bacterium]